MVYGPTLVAAPARLDVPGDPSQAAFWLVAACLVPRSEVTVAASTAAQSGSGSSACSAGWGRRTSPSSRGRRGGPGSVDRHRPVVVVEGHRRGRAAEIPSLDEVPVLAVAAAGAHRHHRLRDVGELRVKETDRLAAAAGLVSGARGPRRGGG